jgi:hypothetical protein
MRRRSLLAPMLIGVLMLAGCSAPSTPAPTVPTVAAIGTPTPTPAQAAAKSARGLLIKHVGDPFGVTDSKNNQLATFVVTGITVDPECTAEYSKSPENGHFVRLDVQGETTAGYQPGDVPLNPAMFDAVADNGTTFNGDLGTFAAYSCIDDADTFPSDLGAGQKASGSIILDVPTASGVLLYPSAGKGWEWSYPQ